MNEWTVERLDRFGRTRLSQHSYMRDFLFSDIAAVHGLINAPDDPDLAVAAGAWRPSMAGDIRQPAIRLQAESDRP